MKPGETHSEMIERSPGDTPPARKARAPGRRGRNAETPRGLTRQLVWSAPVISRWRRSPEIYAVLSERRFHSQAMAVKMNAAPRPISHSMLKSGSR